MRVSGFVALLVCLGAGMVHAQTPPAAPPQDPASEVEGVEIVGHRDTRERTEAFVEGISAPLRYQGLARWDRRICVGVANMPHAESQWMIDRVSAVALAVGLGVGEPGCRADVLIVATPEPDALAAGLVDDNPDTFRPGLGGTDLGRKALERFKQSDAPVRWWQVSLPVSADTGTVATQLKGDDGPPSISSPSMSRLRSGIRFDMAKVIVIIDTRQLGEATFSALSDYVAMVALAQIDPVADVAGYATVLNLFGPSPEAGLTEWDIGYLRSLYSAQRDRAIPSGQVNEIVNDMTRRLTNSAGTPPTP